MTEEELRYHEEDLLILSKLRLMDDDFMTLVFDGDTEATALLLNLILERDDLTVTEVVAQREYKSPAPHGRSIRLDIYAKDRTGKVYDIEVQRADRGATAQRARFNSSMLDTRLLQAGEAFSQLADTYVIFITENDILGKGFPLYHIDRKIEETGEAFGDGAHIIYVNGRFQDHSHPIGKLMHDFRCTDARDMYYSTLAAKVHYFKESEGGRVYMCKLIEDMRNEAAAKAAAKAAAQTAIQTSIETYREFQLSDAEITRRLMEKYGLTQEAAAAHVAGKLPA